MTSAEEYVSPDGRLRLLVETGDDGDVTLGFAGYPWHTHGSILAATAGLPRAEAVRRFVQQILGGFLPIAVWSSGGEVRDAWVSEDPARDARYPAAGEAVELRRWDGTRWPAGPGAAAEAGRGF